MNLTPKKHHIEMAITILLPSPIYSTINSIMKDCISADIDNYKCIKADVFHSIMWQYNQEDSGFNQKGENEDPGSKSEFEEIYDLLSQKYQKNGEFYYNQKDKDGIYQLKNDIIEFKAKKLSKGLIENDRKLFEVYLLDYFEKFDTNKTGTLTVEEILKALQESDKFSLILMQVRLSSSTY